MTDTLAHDTREDEAPGLYLPDCKIIEKLGYGQSAGRRLLQRLDRGIPGMRTYPQPDPIFGRRFWPAVFWWHMDYHRVRRPAESGEAQLQPGWQENFDAAPTSDKARKPESARPELASTRS